MTVRSADGIGDVGYPAVGRPSKLGKPEKHAVATLGQRHGLERRRDR
jgi:hypothetical protein